MRRFSPLETQKPRQERAGKDRDKELETGRDSRTLLRRGRGSEVPEIGEKKRFRLGTSGWHYRHWRGRYYPESLPASQWLQWYSRDFDCVEVNNSFYRLPKPETVRQWRERVPGDFLFAVKASRLITHLKKLKDCKIALEAFLKVMDEFGRKLGPILFQLPPRWRRDLPRLERFVGLLPRDYDYAFEFRDPSWHCAAVYRLLEKRNLAFCQFDIAGWQSPEVVTAELIYIRLHGPSERAYCGSYPDAQLQRWAEKIRGWSVAGHRVFLFFDNDQNAYAVTNALRLKRLLYS